MIFPSELDRFRLLTAVWERARDQRVALDDHHFERFAELTEQRRALLDEMMVQSAAVSELPTHVVSIPTDLVAREEQDARLAIDMVIRGILDLDETNDGLLREVLDVGGRPEELSAGRDTRRSPGALRARHSGVLGDSAPPTCMTFHFNRCR